MTWGEKERVRQAMYAARYVYPGPVGEALFEHLEQWHDFGYRFGGTSRIMALVKHIEEERVKARESERAQNRI